MLHGVIFTNCVVFLLHPPQSQHRVRNIHFAAGVHVGVCRTAGVCEGVVTGVGAVVIIAISKCNISKNYHALLQYHSRKWNTSKHSIIQFSSAQYKCWK